MTDEKKTPAPEPEAPLKISRRDFLVGAGAGVVVTGAIAAGVIATRPPEVKTVEVTREVAAAAPTAASGATPAPQAPAPAAQEVVSGPKLITLRVNGIDHSVAVQPQDTLVEVLRETLGLTGTHVGCNGSYCSACSVLVNGVAQNSCSLLAIREAGKEITTIEGLEKNGQLHPVQQAFWDNMGYQCGFCTSGQIMRTVSLLNTVKKPTDAQIIRHMSGSLCKCSAYPNILKAIKQAADKMA